MTTEEKLVEAIKFIRSIEQLDASNYDMFDRDDIVVNAYCNECGSSDVGITINFPSNVRCSDEYVSTRLVDDLKDRAWHTLVDIAT